MQERMEFAMALHRKRVYLTWQARLSLWDGKEEEEEGEEDAKTSLIIAGEKKKKKKDSSMGMCTFSEKENCEWMLPGFRNELDGFILLFATPSLKAGDGWLPQWSGCLWRGEGIFKMCIFTSSFPTLLAIPFTCCFYSFAFHTFKMQMKGPK